MNTICLKSGLGRLVLTFATLCLACGFANAQNVIKGRVCDANGEPLVGVNVQAGSENAYAITDQNGAYSISLKNAEGAVLKFSLMGMDEVTENVAGRAVINITMQDDKLFLNEVVVTGYQDIQREKLTGSIATVSAAKLEERYAPSIINNLEGRVAGLSTYGGKLSIRGISSMYAESSPLLVVDGLPMEIDIDDLNPYDIESVNVLKDAAAAAIYGARASNGIIVITTKNAREKGKVDVDFSANYTMYEKKNVDYASNFLMNAEQQVMLEKSYYDYYFFGGEVSDPITSFESVLTGTSGTISPIEYAYYQKALGKMSQSDIDALCNRLGQNNFAKEYADAVYKTRMVQQYNLALRNSSDKSSNNLVLNFLHDNTGIINGTDKTLDITYKGKFDIANWLTANMAITGIYSNSRSKGYDYSGISDEWSLPAYATMWNADGSAVLAHNNEYYDVTEGIYKNAGINILDEFYDNTTTDKRQYMRYQGELLFKILSGLTATTSFVYEMDHSTSTWDALQESHVGRDIYNAYTVIDDYGYVEHLTPATGGIRSVTNTDGKYWTGRGQLNYSNTFGKHEIAALIGTEFRETLSNGNKALLLGYDDQLQNAATQSVNFNDLSLMEINPSYLSRTGGYRSRQMCFEPYMSDNMSPIMEQHHRYASYYANATYTYDRRYNVFVSYRKDYADVYGLNVKLRGRPLWSAGAAWNISNEGFMSSAQWIDVLKLRFSYGVTGNIYQGATSYMTANTTGLNSTTNKAYGDIESPANPYLKWEKTATANIGLDFAFVDNRFRGSLDYYQKKGSDLFSYKTLDPATGFGTMFMNVADMVNKGIELTFTGDWFREKVHGDFGWSSTLTFAYNKNEITSVDTPATRAYELIGTPFKTGYPQSAMWSYRFAGICEDEGNEGMVEFYGDNDAKVHNPQSQSIDVLEFSGQRDSKVIMGFDNRFSWNGFSFSILMAYYGGHKMYALCEDEIASIPRGAVDSYFVNAWTPENKTNVPGIGRYASNSTSNVTRYSNKTLYDASFLKIRNVVLSYELPQSFAKKISADRVNVLFQIDNPKALWTANNIGVDPETLGIRIRSSYILGVHVNF